MKEAIKLLQDTIDDEQTIQEHAFKMHNMQFENLKLAQERINEMKTAVTILKNAQKSGQYIKGDSNE